MNAPFPPPDTTAQGSSGPTPEAAPLLGPLPARRVVKKAVILAAGRGKRMGKLTADRPKAALEVGGHALIDWQIAALQAAGVEEIAVVTGHGAPALAGRGVTYIHNPGWAKGTQVATLLCARDWIGEGEPVIVSYGDIIYHPCAPLALLERPGDIIIAYDADHRWLWKKRFRNWLKDSETFRLGPGQVLTEIGGKPTDIEEMDGQFMGLMLLTAAGIDTLARHFQEAPEEARRKLDFTKLLARLISEGQRIDTAANLMPWMEVDSAADSKIAHAMTIPNAKGAWPQLIFAKDIGSTLVDSGDDEPQEADAEDISPVLDTITTGESLQIWDDTRLRAYAEIRNYRIVNSFAVQNWGRSGSTFLQSLFDNHPQVLSTPNFYSRRFFISWAATLAAAPDDNKIEIFLRDFRSWWDTAMLDATAGLHRLGPTRTELAGVDREPLEGYLRAAFATGRPFTQRNLFEAAHLAYALARGQRLDRDGLQIMFPIHGESRGVAAALLEAFPEARFLHTIREPIANVASSLEHACFNEYDLKENVLQTTLQSLFGGRGGRYGRPHTSFANRPYFRHLLERDAFRLVRLEDLHAHGAMLMAELAQWLGLRNDDRLVQSTWDGKVWWNRPESGRESRLGGQPLDRNVQARLSAADPWKIKRLLHSTPYIQQAYPSANESYTLSVWTRLRVIFTPWRQERLARRTAYRSLTALLGIARILPKPVVGKLKEAIRRERYRARLLTMASGAIAVRKTLPDEKKPGAVQGVILLSPTPDGWHTVALAKSRLDRIDQPDRLSVAFLDEAISQPSASDNAFWLAVLFLGWPVAKATAYMKTRLMLLDLTRAPRSRSRPPPSESIARA